MSESTKRSARSESRLSALARQDADRVTPGFSEALHQRVMRSVEVASPFVTFGAERAEQHGMAGAMPYIRWGSRITRWPLARIGAVGISAAAAAAIVVLALVPTMNRLRARGSASVSVPAGGSVRTIVAVPIAPKTSPPPTLNQVADVVKARVQEVVQMAMAEQQYEGLDHDVRLATHYLVDQVPLRAAWLNDEGPKTEQ